MLIYLGHRNISLLCKVLFGVHPSPCNINNLYIFYIFYDGVNSLDFPLLPGGGVTKGIMILMIPPSPVSYEPNRKNIENRGWIPRTRNLVWPAEALQCFISVQGSAMVVFQSYKNRFTQFTPWPQSNGPKIDGLCPQIWYSRSACIFLLNQEAPYLPPCPALA